MNKTICLWLIWLGLMQLAAAQEQLKLTLGGIPLTFIKVPAGQFTMGADSLNIHAQKDEFPSRTVRISQDFYLGRTEVTQTLWEQIMGYNPSVFRGANYPVEMVSWDDCQVFLEKLNHAWTGKGRFRLPTEAEWEYTCRMGEPEFRNDSGLIHIWSLQQYAWFYSRSEGSSQPVASKQPDNMGFYDLMGNLWEWCSDWKASYSRVDTLDPKGPMTGTHKIYRGGSWFNEPQALRPENRNAHPPTDTFTNAGFRLVYTLD